MLKTLHIRNFAIVEALELEFSPGMTVLSGETGAGKSILLDALGLTLGDRADSSVVRHGSERAEVSATFLVEERTAIQEWLRGRALDADGECMIRRVIGTDGRSRGFINGQPAPIQLLKELGEQLVDIHGQHAHQSLLRREVQRELLDGYGGHDALLQAVTEAHRHWRSLHEELEQLRTARAEREDRLALLGYQVEELTALELTMEALRELEEEHNRLANAIHIQEGAQKAAGLLFEGDEGSALSLLASALRELQELEGYDHRLAPISELVDAASIQTKEAAGELRHYLADFELDPERLQWVEQRLGDIHDLARKHRVNAEALPQLLDSLQAELAGLRGAETRLDGLEAEIGKARTVYDEAAARLSAERKVAAERLGTQVTAYMHELGMGGEFACQLEVPDVADPAPLGWERVEFQVTANPGQPLRPLAKVASGGELSRISLSIQVATAGTGGIPTLIFDEVDVGVGGGVAEMVGRRLRRLGEERQVLCVTHQPQVAAQGHHHFKIRKETEGGSTCTRVEAITEEARVTEIARMSGGVSVTEQTLSHAREMIAMAQGTKPAAQRGRRKHA